MGHSRIAPVRPLRLRRGGTRQRCGCRRGCRRLYGRTQALGRGDATACAVVASFGAGSGLGLPIIGRLLGHAQAATTARYAHLDNDPLRRASEAIAGNIAAALEGSQKAPVVSIARNRIV
jgi:integrase